MSLSNRKSNRTASLALAVFLLGACTDVALQPPSAVQSNTDDLVSIKGTICTKAPLPTDFPVKVLFIVDQSGSMCISDPPGAQVPYNSFCNMAYQTALGGIIPTVPGRVRALQSLISQFQTQPNVSVAILPFETNVKQPWPANFATNGFLSPNQVDASGSGDINTFVTNLQNQLGNTTDYQGALYMALNGITADIQATQQNNPQILPRTKYVVVFLTDGTPYPRCTATPNLPAQDYANPYNPSGIFQDDPPDIPASGAFCNATNLPPGQAIDGGGGTFVPGTDRNQNYQLFSYVTQLMNLKQVYNVGDVKFNTVLLFNQANVTACGALCGTVYGNYPTWPANLQLGQGVYMIASWLLQQMASIGNGVYLEFKNQAVVNLDLGSLDYTSLLSRNVMKQLIVRNLSATAGPNGWQVDTDGDGIPDDAETSVQYPPNQWNSSRFDTDTDHDCFGDNFEATYGGNGFNPTQPDVRGCVAPLYSRGPIYEDTDGDGLSQYEEAFLGTDTRLVDSDGDGIPDGLSARYGLNPLAGYKNNVDTDGDGIPDRIEIRAGSNPIQPDVEFFQRFAYQYETVEHPNADGSTCYDYTVSNIHMVSPPSWAGMDPGYNLFKVYFAEAPESGAASDYGVWSSACAWAQYLPPKRNPPGPQITLPDPQACQVNGASPPPPGCFLPTRLFQRDSDYRNPGYCLGAP